MEKKTLTIKGALFIGYMLIITTGYSQKFDWWNDGYNPGGGLYKNIDGSGIDINISGLSNEWGKLFYPNEVITGVDDNGNMGITHNYNFSFSAFVDVEFTILNINRDTAGHFCYNDYLVFSPSPSFSNNSSVTIKGDTILAPWVTSGSVTVKYLNVQNFSIQHGLGIDCNPGHIFLTSLIINNNILSINKVTKDPYTLNKIADQKLSIIGQNSHVNNVHIINSKGQLAKANFETVGLSSLEIETINLSEGIYFVLVEFDSGQILKEKFIVFHSN